MAHDNLAMRLLCWSTIICQSPAPSGRRFVGIDQASLQFADFFNFFEQTVNGLPTLSLLLVIHVNRRSSIYQLEGLKMKNLVAALVAGLFAVSAFAASHTGAPMAAAPMADTTKEAAPKPAKHTKAKKHKSKSTKKAAATDDTAAMKK